MRLRKYVWMAALAVVLAAPASARADWLITPFIGAHFGGDSAKTTLATGASIGWMGAGIIGWEADFGYGNDFFEDQGPARNPVAKSNVFTGMVNVIAGVPVGGQSGAGVRPYVSGGAGWLRTNIKNAGDVITSDNSQFGINAGAGLMGFASDHVGFKADVRYFRALQDPDEDNEFDIALGGLNFWRGSAGLVFRF